MQLCIKCICCCFDEAPGLLHIACVPGSFAALYAEQSGELRVHVLDNLCGGSGFTPPRPQLVDFFVIFNAIAQPFKADGTPVSRVYQETITGGPVDEVRSFKGIAVPGVVCPAQETVQMIGCGKEAEPLCLCGRRAGKGIRLTRVQAHVERGDSARLPALLE